ncbi:MAG: hypothetical protein IH820_16135 [Bacteroidetes bacterium]|nr:hypothetical protein [Bacteroidota bacterium]
MRTRLPHGCHVMLVASAHWDDRRKRFKIRRPPADHVSTICIDSGGFSAARRWGRYPWTPAQYADFVHETVEGGAAPIGQDRLRFVACMDYACEPTVDRSQLHTNRDRIKATIRNESCCHEADPSLPWLPVLQGDTLSQRLFDLQLRRRLGLLPGQRAGVGIGSVCGRGARSAISTILFYRERLPDVGFHGFGLHIQALDHPAAWTVIQSWDSYGWTWGKGQKGVDRPPEYLKREGETYTEHTRRLAGLYYERTVKPRLSGCPTFI